MPHFTCCGLTFDGEPSYVDHRRQLHGEEPAVRHTCCGIQFLTDEGFAEHRQAIHADLGAVLPTRPPGFFARLFRRA